MSGLKRIHLFEFEDLAWFPGWLRDCMTRYLSMLHTLLDTKHLVAPLIARALRHAEEPRLRDLCSGDAGVMLDIVETLRNDHGAHQLEVTFSDLHPNREALARIRALGDPKLRYLPEPLDAASAFDLGKGVRTMICSLHHMRPDAARRILCAAQQSNQPFVSYEIGDNKPPIVLWWLALPIAFVTTLLLTPLIRPMTVRQLLLTYVVPLAPLFVAWDGAVSNARTYTVQDLKQLTLGLESEGYRWEAGVIQGRGGGKVWLLGLPNTETL